ncbi:hypothetical protein ONZ51_g13033 [Trametes cubensis]|uniref:Uncharacterized protein n=1 Tax=Trametes cubensis TaxID=1111947 RepID=A0AAD7X4E9_9APHY|nr:hypothetical protein ONZ51_g13033 [Trametes cubensis]
MLPASHGPPHRSNVTPRSTLWPLLLHRVHNVLTPVVSLKSAESQLVSVKPPQERCRYKTIIDESDVAAGKLAAVINGASTYANRQELDGYHYIFSGPCANLRNDVEACYLKLTDLKSDTSVNARASLLNAPSDAKVACSQAFSENRGQSETTVQGSAPATTTPKGMWGLFTERLPTFHATSSPQSPPAVENANLTPAQAAAVGIFAQAALSHNDIHVQQRQHMPVTTGYARSQTQVSPILDKPHTDVVIASMKDIMLSLATQAPQLDVFRELTLHLKNEIKAYLQALQSANAFPTLDKRTALANMQARVALSSIHWRESHLSRISTSAPSCLASAL